MYTVSPSAGVVSYRTEKSLRLMKMVWITIALSSRNYFVMEFNLWWIQLITNIGRWIYIHNCMSMHRRLFPGYYVPLGLTAALTRYGRLDESTDHQLHRRLRWLIVSVVRRSGIHAMRAIPFPPGRILCALSNIVRIWFLNKIVFLLAGQMVDHH